MEDNILTMKDIHGKRRDKVIVKQRIKSTLPLKYRQYIYRAKKKQLTFELTLDEFNQLLDKQCVYCNAQVNSIDRIDSSLGYMLSNCQSCCSKCNMMKHVMSHDEFITHIKRIHSHIVS